MTKPVLGPKNKTEYESSLSQSDFSGMNSDLSVHTAKSLEARKTTSVRKKKRRQRRTTLYVFLNLANCRKKADEESCARCLYQTNFNCPTSPSPPHVAAIPDPACGVTAVQQDFQF